MHPTTPLTPVFFEAPSRAPTMAQPDSQANTLEQLQTPQQVELLDKIDELRNQGLGYHGISLPQLIVCGDQSCGKSSLLEGLTRLRFPSKAGTCTNFATEVVLRKDAKIQIVCTITPSKIRTSAQQREIAKFKRVFMRSDDFCFPTVIAEATTQMEFGAKADKVAFYEDVLRIKYSGPDLPSLTIVDLPGIIEGQLDGGSGAEKVVELVRSFMRDEKSIILAVVAATYDAELQRVFTHLNDFDKPGSRTLGIITKPDKTECGGEDEKQMIMLAKNEKVILKHGWHAVRNRGFSTMEQTDTQRDETERAFFASGAWSALPKDDIGIANLRVKLSRMLLEHIGRELPDLVNSVQSAIVTTEASLKALGGSRDTSRQQRGYLTGHAEKFQMLTHDALRGIYSDTYSKLSGPDEPTPTRLRNEIQNLNISFASIMYRKGHTWVITNEQAHVALDMDAGSASILSAHDYDAWFDDPKFVTRTEFLNKHIGNHVRQSRTSGLPSLVNPGIIAEVFRHQSQMWRKIATHHLRDLFKAVSVYIEHTLRSLMDTRTCSMVLLKLIQPELDRRWQDVEAKLEELLVPYTELDPITYDPGFLAEIQAMRVHRNVRLQSERKSSLGAPTTTTSYKSIDDRPLTESLDDFTNSEILDLMQAYYKRAISVFINNIAVLAIENCLLKNLSCIFSPSLISNLSDEALRTIAAESGQIRDERTSLRQKLNTLKSGKDVLHEHMAMRPCITTEMSTPFSLRESMRRGRPSTPPPRQRNANVLATSPPDDIDILAESLVNLSVTPPSSRSRQRSRAREDSAIGIPREKSRRPSPLPWAMRNSEPKSTTTSDED